MEKEQILRIIKEARANSQQRKFKQTFDFVINLKSMDLKKPEHKINAFVVLPHGRGKKAKICALVDIDLVDQAKIECEKVIDKSQFPNMKEKKELKRLVSGYDYFLAEASIMPQIAATFGKVLGPAGKMPNPKAGCIVPPKSIIKPVCERLRNTVNLQTKNEITIKAPVGTEDMKDDEIAENIQLVYNTILHVLPQEKANIKSILLKLTMGKPAKFREEEK